MRTLRGAHAERRVEVTIDARDHQKRSRDLEAEVQVLRAEVRRLRTLVTMHDRLIYDVDRAIIGSRYGRP